MHKFEKKIYGLAEGDPGETFTSFFDHITDIDATNDETPQEVAEYALVRRGTIVRKTTVRFIADKQKDNG
jgi:hypothetical protein